MTGFTPKLVIFDHNMSELGHPLSLNLSILLIFTNVSHCEMVKSGTLTRHLQIYVLFLKFSFPYKNRQFSVLFNKVRDTPYSMSGTPSQMFVKVKLMDFSNFRY